MTKAKILTVINDVALAVRCFSLACAGILMVLLPALYPH